MEQDEKQLTQEESLRIIREMISAAKNDVKNDAFIFLLWGWLVFIASITQFIMIELNYIELSSLAWMLMPIGGVITVIYSMRKAKKDRTRTNVTESLKYTWIAFTVSMCIIMFCSSMGWSQILPCIMVLYGLGLFLSGGAMQFKPLIFGGIFCWVCAVTGFLIHNDMYLLLIIAVAVLGGYIIPGYLLKMNNKK